MTDTQWYMVENILMGAKNLKQGLSGGHFSWLDYARRSNDLQFRDSQGSYWFLDALQTSWYRFDGRDWQFTRSAPTQLEGPVTLSSSLGLFRSQTIDRGDPFEGKGQLTAPEAFQTMVEARRKAFTEGSLTSQEVEEVLKRLLLLDKQGGFWTLGIHTGRWYCFREGNWQAMEQPPQASQMVIGDTDSALGQLSEQAGPQVITFLLSGAGSIPEPVSAPWTPPASYPNLDKPYRICAVCGNDNPTGSKFCNQCGSQLGCPNCGAENPPGSRFCNHCGAALLPTGSA